MKLYVVNQNNQKVYLNVNASTKAELIGRIGGQNFYLGDKLYSVYDVKAENELNSYLSGAVVGGVIGALSGPIGIAVGGILGGILGKSADEKENLRVQQFNNS